MDFHLIVVELRGPPPEETEVLDVRVPDFPWSSGGIYGRVQRDPRRGAIGDWKWSPREIWGEVRGCESRSKHFGRERLDRDEVHGDDRALQRVGHRESVQECHGDRALQRVGHR